MSSTHGQLFSEPALTGFVQIQSERGRLQYLPESIYTAFGFANEPLPPLFQGRRVRPHRIHIARVAPDIRVRKPKGPSRRTKTVSIIVEKFGKLAGPRDSAKRFLKSIISDTSSNNTPASTPAPTLRGEPAPSEPTPPRTTTERPSSWAPGAGPQPRARRRPTSGLWAEAKRRSFLLREPAEAHEEPMRPTIRHSIAAPIGVAASIGNPNAADLQSNPSPRNSMLSGLSGLTTGSGSVQSVQPDVKIPNERPIATGNGIAVSIALAEPMLFLQGFEQGDVTNNRSTTMLRGSLHVKITKATKIKAVTLRFRGRAITKWPEGIPPKKSEFEEVNSHINHTWPFFNAQFPTAETGTGADHVRLAASKDNRSSLEVPSNNSSTNLSSRDLKKLSLQVNQSRSFGKGESPTGGPTVAQKGFRTFQPGDYIYNFELPVDSHLPETIDVDLGSVKYELEATVERAGAFKANLIGTKEVVVIRTPAEGSLEQVEPIAISRNWEDQLHYDIVISGKSFPLGAKVPIAFKLTPLAKVQCHRIKVFVTESVEYYCSAKRVHRMEPTRKVQLFEKRSDAPPTSTFPGSTMRIVSGGGVPYDLRAAAASGENVPTSDPGNLLGDLEGNNIGPTEMEFEVQLPSCVNSKERDRSSKLHFDTTYTNIQVHHWIKIVMRLSKPDANDPTKRRHFEISIDSPFHILSCRATQANTSLPAYTSPDSETPNQQLYECGCPGAAPRRTSPTSYVPTLNSLSQSREVPVQPPRNPGIPGHIRPISANVRTDSIGLSRPQAAHVAGPAQSMASRPIHMLRAPSFNPPAFDEDEAPPPALETPPPQYDTIASPTTGLADYFARLSDAYTDESPTEDELEDGQRTPTGNSRVEVPLTPGGSRHRSMDEVRTWPSLGPISLTLPGTPPVGAPAQAQTAM